MTAQGSIMVKDQEEEHILARRLQAGKAVLTRAQLNTFFTATAHRSQY